MVKILTQRDGSALVATTLLSMMILASVFAYTQISSIKAEGQIHRMGTQRALEGADAVSERITAYLRSPEFQSRLPPGAIDDTLQWNLPNGRAETTLYRTSVNTNLVEAHTTAYFYLGKGSEMDSATGQAAQMAVLHTKYRVTNLAQFMFALPAPLTVYQPANIADGIVYARELTLDCSGAGTTRIKEAWYLEGSNDPAPPCVEFTASPETAQRLSFPPGFPSLGGAVRTYYQSKASANPLPTFSGTVGPPTDTQVYYSNGDLSIGGSGPLEVSGAYTIYSSSNVIIHNNITLADANSWVAILAEKDILLAGDIPHGAFVLNGNFLANWSFSASSPNRVAGDSLAINGGVVSYENINLTPVWAGRPRTYSYKTLDDPRILLPNFATLLEYRIIRGKFNQ